MIPERRNVKIYTDGSCKGTGKGPGGWAAILECDGYSKIIYGGEKDTTNNRMEMEAVRSALKELTEPCSVEIVSDSKYVLQGTTEWVENWANNGWRTTTRRPVENKDMWTDIKRESDKHTVIGTWVKGHGKVVNKNTLGNAVVDEIAQITAEKIKEML